MHSLLNCGFEERARSGEESWTCTTRQTQIRLARRIHRFFPAPITPASEISLTSSLTAGGLSDFNHTSMLVPQNNLHCLSVSPALFRVCIDPASALFCDPELSVTSRPRRCPQGQASAGSGSREEGGRMTISPPSCHRSCDVLMSSFSVRTAEGVKQLDSLRGWWGKWNSSSF